MKTLITRLLIIFFIVSCSPKINSHTISKPPPLSNRDEILVLQKGENFSNDGIEIGIIKEGDNGLSVNCSYEDVVAKLTELARKDGANVIQITDYKEPDKWSSCVRLTAHIYKVPDVTKHEVAITWSANRKLTWNDFKGQPKPDMDSMIGAQTYCGIHYKGVLISVLKAGEINVSAEFNCNESWVKADQTSSTDLLEHEQGHFDLCEVYARMLRQKLKENNITQNKRDAFNELISAFTNMYLKRQDLYDAQTNHGLNRKAQIEWQEEITTELNKLSKFAQ